MNLKPWNLQTQNNIHSDQKQQKHTQKRWQISVVLQTDSPLHIGSGEFCDHPDLKDDKDELVDVNACIKGKDELPIIPGSTIKGKLLQWLQARKVNPVLIDTLFGKGHDQPTGDQGNGGKAEFHDAPIEKKLSGDQPWPYWRENFQTYIEASTAIDRHTRSALHQSLHYTEAVPPDVQFKLTVTGVMTEQEAAVVVAALDSFDKPDQMLYLGADDANGYGRMKLVGHLDVRSLGPAEIATWLDDFKTNQGLMPMTSVEPLASEQRQQLKELGQQVFTASASPEKIDITLQFDGPFLVNDPYTVKKRASDNNTKTDHYPLLVTNHKPRLPTASIRGVLRAQAERIIRTLGGKCCDSDKPCDPIYKIDDLENKLCLACQIFGASGWKSLLIIDEFKCESFLQQKKQDFVAIDRFHGGGKDGAKFDATHVERPCFTGAIRFSPRMEKNGLTWGKGLLALVLRDLREGDPTFGFGANKGYGGLESATISGFDPTEQDQSIMAFRSKVLEVTQPWTCHAAATPATKSEKTPLTGVQKAGSGFHNPYQFIPVPELDTGHWLPDSKLNKDSYHSHGFYRNRINEGEKLHHGRIICRLTTETPTFIGAGKNEDTVPSEIHNYRLNNKLAIPATSLRGMLSSLAESASNSAMRVLDDGLLSYRKKADDALRNIGMVIFENKKWHVLPMTTLNNAIKLKHAYTSPDMMDFIENNQSWSPDHNRVYYLPEDADYNAVPESDYAEGKQPGILRILGKQDREQELENKKHELFIKVPLKYVDTDLNLFNFQDYKNDRLQNVIEIPDEIMNRYTELADQRTLSQKSDKDLNGDDDCLSSRWLPFHLKGGIREHDPKKAICKLPMQEFDLIYYDSHHGLATDIAFSSIWRGRVPTHNGKAARVHSFFPKELLPYAKQMIPERQRTALSPAELLFGFTQINLKDQSKEEDMLSFAGKVRISAGTVPDCKYPEDENEMLDEEVTLKALSTPKPPSPALYFRNQNGDSNDFIEKQKLDIRDHKTKGRKYYLHALRKKNGDVQHLSPIGEIRDGNSSNPPWKTDDIMDQKKLLLKSKISPIKKEKSFYFHLDFNNLTDWELGLLCYAIRPTETFQHRIGMGKPIGLGSVKIDLLALQTIDRNKRYLEDPLDAERFNENNWYAADSLTELDQARYPVVPASGNLEPEPLRKTFTDTMDADIYRALELLGNPDNIGRPVHYPQVDGKNIELENFKWFVANDQGSGQKPNKIEPAHHMLNEINQDSDKLPALTRHPWRGD